MRRAALALALVLAGCGGGGRDRAASEAAAPIPAPAPDAITRTQDAGPAAVTLQVWPTAPTLGDPIWVRLEVVTKPGVHAELPFDQLALGRFQVLRYAPESAPTADGGQRQVGVYELAAPMSGKHRIPPLRVDVTAPDPDHPDAAPVHTELLTDEISLDVGTVLADKTDRELARGPGAIVTRVGGGGLSPWLFVGFAAVGFAGGAAAFLLTRKRQLRRAQVSAWEVAMRELDALAARGAPPPDDPAACDAWFVTLSAVVRRYVEGRFRLRAPELTTEEFLGEAQRIPELAGAHRDGLAAFLAKCDQVKFAGLRPSEDESLAVLASAREFVVATRVPDEQPAVRGAA